MVKGYFLLSLKCFTLITLSLFSPPYISCHRKRDIRRRLFNLKLMFNRLPASWVTTKDPFHPNNGLWKKLNWKRSLPRSSATLNKILADLVNNYRKESESVVIQLTISPCAYVMTPCPNWCFPSSQKFKIPQTALVESRVSSSKNAIRLDRFDAGIYSLKTRFVEFKDFQQILDSGHVVQVSFAVQFNELLV